MERMVQASREAGEGETLFTGIARVERLAWAMPGATGAGDGAPALGRLRQTVMPKSTLA